ncbi:Crp/Fnr family transcriptional regulator [Microvirga yunnanensis]|uniref:Crp/Fnr family transcriptional regulator n=1 Tax=Microvirga yunnanensis TaxID=2953740 RepID=UPI0021C730BA|nr:MULTISPECIES: Crp/Fnr family transcriptional regulator [unclassified Microvirga]
MTSLSLFNGVENMDPQEEHGLIVETSLHRDHRTNRLLAALEPADFAVLEPHLEIVDLRKCTVLYEAGEPIQHTYFPHDAIVSLVEDMEDGRVAEVALFGCEAVFGLLSTFISGEALGRYVVLVPGTASRIPVEQMRRALVLRSRLRRMVAAFNEALLAQVFQAVACNALHPVEARCCRWLLNTHDRIDRDTLPLTHETLAEMLGVQRSTVSTVLGALQAAGLIAQRRGGIVVTDRLALEQAACECYSKVRLRVGKVLPGTYDRPDPNKLYQPARPVRLPSSTIKPRR